MKLYRRLLLFFGIVWREWEPKSCGIPEQYRIYCRVGIRLAWGIAKDIHRGKT